MGCITHTESANKTCTLMMAANCSSCLISSISIKTKAKCSFQAEDRVDELSKDLSQIRHRLQATEEEKRGKEEEAAMVHFMTLLQLSAIVGSK